MTTWEVIKKLLREIGFYRKKLFLFVILVVVGLLVYFLWLFLGKTEAAIQFGNLPPSTIPESVLEVVIQKNGQVLIDSEKNNRVLRFYENYDELRILVFDSPGQYISSFRGRVHLPKGAVQDQVRPIIYAVHGVSFNQAYLTDSETILYEAMDISPTATLTIVAQLPKGLIQPNFWQTFLFKLSTLSVKSWLYLAIVFPLVTLIIMFFMLLKRQKARMIKIRGFLGGPPENIAPAITGVLLDGEVGSREIAATLIDLARRGYIFIINKGNGQFSFGIRKSGDVKTLPGLKDFEKVLLDKIFMPKTLKSTLADVEMRIGRHIFSRKIAQFYLEIYNQATLDGYFVKNPAKIHLAYRYTGVGLFFASFLGFMLGAILGPDPKYGLFFWIGGMIASSVIIKFSPYLPARTQKGVQQLQEWLEFREYLMAKKPLTGTESIKGKFEEYLAYAIVLGAEIEWVKRFTRAPFTKPDWYESSERLMTFENFAGELFPLIGYVAENLARAHEPTVE